MSEKILVISPKGEEKYLNAAVWKRVKQSSQFAGWTAADDYEGGNTDKVITKLPPEVEEMQRRMMEQSKTIIEVKKPADYIMQAEGSTIEEVMNNARKSYEDGGVTTSGADANCDVEKGCFKGSISYEVSKSDDVHKAEPMVDKPAPKPAAKKPESGKAQPVEKKNPGK